MDCHGQGFFFFLTYQLYVKENFFPLYFQFIGPFVQPSK